MKTRALAAGAIGALVAAGFLVAPAFGAADQPVRPARRAAIIRDLGGFTPAAADPRMAAMFAHGGLSLDGLRFTPADTRRDQAVTVAVRARTARTSESARLADAGATTTAVVGLAPITYNLGAGVGWRRVAITGDAAKIDLGGQPGSREAADVSVSYAGARLTGRVKATADRPMAGVALIDGVNSYSLDVGGSYALTRRLDLTAGVRYRTDREQLTQLDDGRHNSQAVYIGTAFRF